MVFGKIIKTFTSKKGTIVVFRYPNADDLDAMLTYVNALVAEDTYIELCKRLTRKDEEAFLKKSLENMIKGELVKVIVTINAVFAGIGDVRRMSHRKHHVGQIGISLGKKFREEGIGTELMKVLIKEARQLGLRLLVLSCFENNPRALHVYEKLGFQKAGIVPGEIFFKGQYIGEVTFYLPLSL